mmetsp:Transcript_25455/g.63033  ORF Transcript_25455/g.63033 Transcript_25455/m.63033 type:complete len:207 (-) Transcript_25455:777-1397(-)
MGRQAGRCRSWWADWREDRRLAALVERQSRAASHGADLGPARNAHDGYSAAGHPPVTRLVHRLPCLHVSIGHGGIVGVGGDQPPHPVGHRRACRPCDHLCVAAGHRGGFWKPFRGTISRLHGRDVLRLRDQRLGGQGHDRGDAPAQCQRLSELIDGRHAVALGGLLPDLRVAPLHIPTRPPEPQPTERLPAGRSVQGETDADEPRS